MADLGQFPFKVRGVDLADTARIDAKGPAVSILDTAVFPEDRQVAAGGSFGVTVLALVVEALLRIGTLYAYREADSDKVPQPAPFADRMLDRYRVIRGY